ncbi:DUF1559 family PulG-like putative transporter [Tuwongella immobilis]|uniref:DUF1559 domain-containing protein n=1 Tax=Tuwongella immobilis TaxID=692036 RepID=A0A6C2YUF1_9BACT|nr:DUF1559 domain-containing protein [Tuwongella immobilis]VIP04492.1 Uncharacterized protein OS=Pirellula staleyi (strain ATCC 27377 / DSM 6068 / ICPB 4128) GN=Psta_0324 PE=4 SV=1: SBP_bac_10 [Tuwongella immobilis]VTS06346.1 Uncharacterized protein OS=Pirellula staleyi (strain ATCC 27377 / DSM 6068 / ICPB 4128) GN=Psta_0324 PE=4 SV=1: SBP_bac_10 [Tuwongella immobilis]
MIRVIRQSPRTRFSWNRSPRQGFALRDLLVGVVFAVGLLGLALPAVMSLRSVADRAKCADHLRNIGQGARGYATQNQQTLPRDRVVAPRSSWNTEILPYIGQEALARQYRFEKEWYDASPFGQGAGNRAVAQARVPIFLCPAAPSANRQVLTQSPDAPNAPFRAGATDYVGSAGAYYLNNDPASLHSGAMQHRKITRRIREADVQDGTSFTLLVVEMADKPNQWHAGKLKDDRADVPQMPALAGQWAAPNWNHLRSHSWDGQAPFGPCAVNCSNGAAIYAFHPNGANALFVDGSVRFLRSGMSQEMLIALVSIAGGELLSATDF